MTKGRRRLPRLCWSLVMLLAAGTVSVTVPAAESRYGEVVSVMDCFAAGDYRWTELSAQGGLLFLRAGSDWRVFEEREEELSPEATRQVFERLRAIDLSRFETFYPLREVEGIDVEHRYYALAAGRKRVSFVTAHEYTMPRALEELVASVQQLVGQPVRERSTASRLVILPADMLGCLGQDADLLDLAATSDPLSAFLSLAAATPGRSVEVPENLLGDLRSLVFGTRRVVRMQRDGEEHAIVLFERGS